MTIVASTDAAARPLRLVIIGGGITGLSAAWEFQQRLASTGAQLTLLEAGQRWGGKIVTAQFGGGQGVPTFVVDAGPESFVTRKPAAWDLASELGLAPEVIDPGNETRNIYILDGGRPIGVPLAPVAFVRSPLLSTRGKLRMLAEPFLRGRRDDGDESLADFVTRRLGREALEKFMGPILGGIYNTDPEQQSILTTSPVMREMEREHGSLVWASVMRMRARAQERRLAQAQGKALPPRFMTFRQGAQRMVEALVGQLRADLRLNAPVTAVHPSLNEDGTFVVELAGGERLPADGVLIATTANVAAGLLRQLAPAAAQELAQIRHVHIGTITLAMRAVEAQLPFPISGLMIPRRERRAIDAITFPTTKFPDRTPAGYITLRVFFGGGAPALLEQDDAGLTATVLAELQALLGISAQPVAVQINRWPDSYPQAGVGHLAHVDAIEQRLPAGMRVAGSSYRGLAVPDCIAQGRAAAAQLLAELA